MDAKRSPGGIVKAVRRRAGLIVASGLASLVLACVVSVLRPRAYTACARLEVAGVNNLAAAELQSRVAAANEQVRSHEAMEEVCRKLTLDKRFESLAEAERNERRQQLVQDLRDRTSVATTTSGAGIEVRVSHKGPDPELCAKVAAELSSWYQHSTADQPTAEQQKVVAEAVKAEADARAVAEKSAAVRAEYRKANAEMLDGASEKLAATQEELRQLEQTELAGYEKQKKDLEGLLAKETPFVVGKVRQPDALRLKAIDDKIKETSDTVKRLKSAESRTDDDPKVVSQANLLKQLQSERMKVLDEAPLVEQKQTNEQYAALSKALRDLQGKVDSAGRRRARLKEQERDQRELAKRTPEIVAKDKELAAAEEASKKEHDARVTSLARARQTLEELQRKGALAIREVEAPSAPRSPSGPAPAVLGLAGLLAGAGIGLTAALTLHSMDRSFRDPGAVSAFLGVPTIGAVRLIQTPAEAAHRRHARRRRTALLSACAIFAALVFFVALFGDVRTIQEFVKSVVG